MSASGLLTRSSRCSITRPFTCQTSAVKRRTSGHACRIRQSRTRLAPCAASVPSKAEVVVVGAGLAGLNAAAVLRKKGIEPIILETSDGIGGRVRTDVVDGFLLDRGFQIFLTGYPEVKATLDLEALQLQPFYAGARVWFNGSFHTVADPLRHFADGLQSLTNPIGSVMDKINVGLFRLKSLVGPLDAVLAKPETTTLDRLKVREADSDWGCYVDASNRCC
eukprot:GHRR01025712.1.p1 GENE.GHRR01025712.1~~GHRR01025712.1.p1  ORF type:complete len:221 (+),score=28.56 GHRR01025712.1:356-1018(+)